MILFSTIITYNLAKPATATKSIIAIPTRFSVYNDPTFKYRLQIPSNWTLHVEKSEDESHLTLEPYNSIPLVNQYNPHFYINVSRDISLSRMPAILDNTLHSSKNVKITQKSQSPFILGGITGYSLAWSYQDPNYGKLAESRTVLWKGDKTYDVSFRAKQEDYKALLPTMESMIASITIQPDPDPLTEKTGDEILNALQPHALSETTGQKILTEKTGDEILKALQPLKALEVKSTTTAVDVKKLGQECKPVGAGASSVIKFILPVQIASARIANAACKHL